jgi:hypothetical protein
MISLTLQSKNFFNMKYLICMLCWLGTCHLSAQSAPQRTIAVRTDVQVMEDQLNLLHLAIADQSAGKIQQAENEIMGLLRQFVLDTRYNVSQVEEMTGVLATFEGFTFVGAEQKVIDAHVEHLERVLAVIRG